MAEQDIDAELLRSLLDYDPITGALTWRPRPREMFKRDSLWKRWNSRYAGRGAFLQVSHKGYLTGQIFRTSYRAHRVIWAMMTGSWPPDQIDHINGVRSDNRLANLRAVSGQENMRNQRMPVNNTSGAVGVTWDKRRRRWLANLVVSGRCIYIGSYALKDDAIAARRAAQDRHGYHPNHGREART